MKVSNADFITAVATKGDYPKAAVKDLFKVIQDVLEDELKEGNSVKVLSWMTVEPVEKAARQCRNPRTGATIDVPAKVTVKAKFGNKIKEALN